MYSKWPMKYLSGERFGRVSEKDEEREKGKGDKVRDENRTVDEDCKDIDTLMVVNLNDCKRERERWKRALKSVTTMNLSLCIGQAMRTGMLPFDLLELKHVVSMQCDN